MRPGIAELVRQLPGAPSKAYLRTTRVADVLPDGRQVVVQCADHEGRFWSIFVVVKDMDDGGTDYSYHLADFTTHYTANEVLQEVLQYIQATNRLKGKS